MMRRQVLVGLLLVGMAGVAGAADKAATALPPVAERGTNVQVIAYYFHGTMRCETCLKIERQAREAIERRFAVELAGKRLVFEPVNYDKPENAHYLKDYKLPCPSLVLVRQKDKQKWKLLGQTWEFVHIPPKLDLYIEEETSKFLEAAK